MKRLALAVAALLAGAPAAQLAWLVGRYGVDVPYHDQWPGELPLFEKLAAGRLTFTDLWEPHNEHRLLFPRLLFVLLGRLSGWNVRVELGAIVVAALVTAGCLFVLLRRTWPGEPLRALFAAFLVNLFVFSPIQHQNWLWGFQIQFLLPVLCLAAICALPERWSARRFGAVAFALCAVSTFSLGAGFLVWPACLPLWLARQPARDRPRAALGWALGLGACLALYLHGYVEPPRSLARVPGLDDVGPFGDIFFGMLGHPVALAWGKGLLLLALGLGIAGVLAYAGLVAASLRRETGPVRLAVVAWACLGLHALLATALVTVGRAGGGIGTAFVSRYTTLTVYLWIAVLVLALRLLDRRSPALAALVALGAVAWSVPSYSEGRYEMEARFSRLSRGKVLLVLAPLFPAEARPDYLGYAEMPLVEKATRLARLGWLRPPSVLSREIAKLATLEPGVCGAIEEAYPDRQRVRLLGYALLGDPRLPDAVLLTYRRGRGPATVFAWATTPGRSRPELAERLRCPGCLEAGWEAHFRLPERLQPAVVEAWAYDVQRGTACRLEGSYRVAD